MRQDDCEVAVVACHSEQPVILSEAKNPILST